MNAIRVSLPALFFSLCVLAQPAVGMEVPRDPYEFFFNQTLGDFSEELEIAKEEGKKGILVFFEMDECPFCHRMKKTVLNQPRVQRWYRENFLSFTVDIEGDTEVVGFDGETMLAKDFAAKLHKVRATPVFAFFDLTGKRVLRFTGATRNAREFLWLGEFVADGHFRTTNFNRFKRAKRKAGQT